MGKFLERHFSLVFFLPVAVLSVLLIIYPMLYGIYVSFLTLILLINGILLAQKLSGLNIKCGIS